MAEIVSHPISGHDTRSVNSDGTQTNDNIRQILSTRDFSLNIDRALRRKISGCKQVMVEYECTGGGITGTMDTASFELFRAACTKFYSSLPSEEGTCEIDFSQDKKRKAVVQQTYRFRHGVDGRVTGYTINLYSTNNRLLINGKDIDTLMVRHLPILHEIMCQGLRDGEIGSVQEFNNILAEQMSIIWRQRRGETAESTPQTKTSECAVSPSRKIQNDSIKMNLSNLLDSPCADIKQLCDSKDKFNNSPKQTENTIISPEQAICDKCKRNVRKNAAVCQIGKHWMHYKCDRLSEMEINRLHNDQGYIYNCKKCSSQETTCKTIAENSDTTIKLKIPECNTSEGTALGILKEETYPKCSVCDTCISENESVCSTCNLIFHLQCMSESNEEMCLGCASNEMQLAETNAAMKVNTLNSPHDKLTQSTQRIAQSIQSNHKEQDTSQNNARNKKDVLISQTNSQKQRELRQTELRLRKWEEELRIREAKCTETYQGVTKLEEYVRKVEARNQELHETIRTLKRKIETHDTYTINSSANTITENLPHEQNVTNRPDPLYDSNKLILGVQNQVTNFIMRKVAKQLLQLEQMDEIVQTEVEKTDYRDRGVYAQNREMTQQQGHTEATVAHEKLTADPEQQAASCARFQTGQPVNPNLNAQVLPPHLIKTIPPPSYHQGQPLFASGTPPSNPLRVNQPPALPPRMGLNSAIDMAPVNLSGERPSFLRQTMPQKQRM